VIRLSLWESRISPLSLWERVRVRADRTPTALTPALSQRERGLYTPPAGLRSPLIMPCPYRAKRLV